MFARPFAQQVVLKKCTTARSEYNPARVPHHDLRLLRGHVAGDAPIAINNFPRDGPVRRLEFLRLAGFLWFAKREQHRIFRQQRPGAFKPLVRRKQPALIHRLFEKLAMPEVARFHVEDCAALPAEPLARTPDGLGTLIK